MDAEIQLALKNEVVANQSKIEEEPSVLKRPLVEDEPSESTIRLREENQNKFMSMMTKAGRQELEVDNTTYFGAMCYALLLTDTKPGASSKHFTCVLLNPVSIGEGDYDGMIRIPHKRTPYEVLLAEDKAPAIKRPPEFLKSGTVLTFSSFKFQGVKQAARAGHKILINGLTFGVQIAEKNGTGKDNDEETELKEVHTRVGDACLAFSAQVVTYVSQPNYDELCELLASTTIGPIETIPGVVRLPYPENVPRKDIIRVAKIKKEKYPIDKAMVPFDIPVAVLYSHMYPKYHVAVRIYNSFYTLKSKPTKEFFSRSPELFWGSVPDIRSQGQKDLLYTKAGEQIERIGIRGPAGAFVGKSFNPYSKQGMGDIHLVFFESGVTPLGIGSTGTWVNAMPQIWRVIDCMATVELNVRKSQYLKDPDNPNAPDYDLHGIGNIIAFNAVKTMHHAGIRVSRKFAVDSLLSYRNANSMAKVTSLESDASSINANLELFRKADTKDSVKCICLNDYTGDAAVDFPEPKWQVYAIPPSSMYSKMDKPPKDLIAMQDFGGKNEKNSVIQNETFVKESWLSNDQIASDVSFVVVTN